MKVTTKTGEEKKIKNPKFAEDIDALEAHIGSQLEEGMKIETTLSELLSVCPRPRKRADSYKSLTSHLAEEYGVTLSIEK